MLKKLTLFLASLFVALPLAAQVQIGGHVYVPSSTDSSLGAAYFTTGGSSTCNAYAIVAPCVLSPTPAGAQGGADMPWVGTIYINSLAGAPPYTLLLPWTVGRNYTIVNQTGHDVLLQAWNIPGAAVSGTITDLAAASQVLLAASYKTTVQSYEAVNASTSTATPLSIFATMPCTTATFLTAAATSSQTTLTVSSTACLNPAGGYLLLADPSFGGNIVPDSIEYVKYTAASGTSVTGVTRGQLGSTALAWSVSGGGIAANPAVVDGVVALQTLSLTTTPSFAYMQDGASLTGMDAGAGWALPGSHSQGPSYSSTTWNFGSQDTPIEGIGAPCFAAGPNWDMGNWPTVRCEGVNANFAVGSMIYNYNSGATARTIFGLGNDDDADGGTTSFLIFSKASVGATPLGSESPTQGGPATSAITSTGGPLWIGTSQSVNGIDPVIHFQYGVQQNGFGTKNTDDARIDSTGYRILDAAPATGGPQCATVSTTGLIGHSGAPCPLSSTITSATGALGLTANCTATGGCTNLRGTYSMTGTQVGTGTFLTLVWPATTTAYNCIANQNGQGGSVTPIYLYIGHSIPTTTGMIMNLDAVTNGAGFTVDYQCQP